MTDKQIIIDGVDVSGCEWIREVGLDSEYICTCNSPNKTSGYCKYNPNCGYKQLKRKEQECEELKRLIDKQKNAKIQLSKLKDKQYKEFCDMKQTLTEIKEIAEKLKNFYEELGKCEDLTVVRLKQILQKISEVLDEEI